MTQVIIQDETPRTQLIAAAGQTVFNTLWTADAASDIDVYARADGVEADDVTQIVSPSLYNVTFIGVSQTVRVTFLSGRTLDDIITIVRNTPAERLNLYINTNFTPSMLNQDFGLLTLIDQQNQMYDTVVNPGYNVSATIDPIIDRVLPILEANQIWAMNPTRTEIIAYDVPSGGGLAPSNAEYLIRVAHVGLPNAQVMGSLASGFVVNTASTGVQLSRVLTAVANQTAITNGTGIAGNPTIGLADNAIIPGTEGMGVPIGTTAQRPVSPIITDFRFNTDLEFLEYWDGGAWVQISESDGVTFATGTENQVLVNGTFGIPTEGAITLTTPQDIAPASSPTFANVQFGILGQIRGANGLPVMNVLSLASAVNWISMNNQITGVNPGFVAIGADINVGIGFVTQAAGFYTFATTASSAVQFQTGTSYQHISNLIFPNTAATRNVTFQDASGTLAYLSDIPAGTPSALTKSDDTNVTLTLGGSPSVALLAATSLSLGWTGQLSLARGGTNASLAASNGGIVYSTTTGLAILSGSATAGQMLQSGAGAAPAWSTATFPTTATSTGTILRANGTNWVASTSTFADTYAASTILYASSSNIVAGLATANSSVLITNSTGVPSMSGALANGQLIIGSTGATPVVANLTAGSGISISNTAGGITISGTGSGTGFTEVTGTTQAMVPDAGYVTNNAGVVTLTLPVTAAFGTAITVVGKGAGGWKIAQNASQLIHVGSAVTTTGVGGSLASTNQYDSIDLVCVTANTVWVAWGAPQSSGLTVV